MRGYILIAQIIEHFDAPPHNWIPGEETRANFARFKVTRRKNKKKKFYIHSYWGKPKEGER